MPSREIMPQLPACCFYLGRILPPLAHLTHLTRLKHLDDDAVSLDSKRLNGRFRSRPSYDHPAVSGSPLVELHPREFVVALFHELRPLMRGLRSRAPLRRQTISSRVRIRTMYNITTAVYRVPLLFLRLNILLFPFPPQAATFT